MKKALLLIVVSLFALSSLFAVSLDDIINGAKELSPTYQNVILSYENSLINIRNLERKDKVGVAVSASVDPLYEKVTVTRNPLTGTMVEDSNKGFNASSTATVTLPNDGKTTITGGVGVTTFYDGSSTATSLSLDASHTFDFTGYSSSTSDDLTLATTKYSTELSKSTSELNFEKSVINTVSAILSYEKNIKKAQKSLDDQKSTVEKMETLGTYSKSSTTYINAVNVLNQLQASLDAAVKQYENALKSFEKVSGMEWTGLDEIPEPVLDLKIYDNGNTSVLISSLKAEAAVEEYKAEAAKLNPMSLSISGKVSGTISDSSSTTISGSLSYTGDNWSLSATPGVTITKDKTTPSLTISGKWSNGGMVNTKYLSDSSNNMIATSNGYSDEDTLTAASNKMLSAQNDYRDALSSYFDEAQSLSLRVLSWEASYSNAKASLDYAKTVYENEKVMLEYGFSTEKDVKSAELNMISTEYDLKTTMLEGLSLERDLKIFAL